MLTAHEKDLWVSALTDGRHRRVRGILHDKRTNSYCAIGLLNLVAPGARLGESMSGKIIEMNDTGFLCFNKYSWRQIARWVEANVPVRELGTVANPPVRIGSTYFYVREMP